MTEKEKNEKLIQENLAILLEEFTREQQVNHQLLASLKEEVADLGNRLSMPRQETDNTMAVMSGEILRTTQEAALYSKLAATKKRPVERKFVLQLFPETDAKLFYKIVFGRWFLMLVVLYAFSCIYKFCLHQSDDNLKIELKKVENARLKKAWDSLYQTQNTRGKKKMNNIFQEIK